MSIRVINGDWPRTASERAVAQWLKKIGLDSTSLYGYEICAKQGGASIIKLELGFDEDVDAEVTGLDTAEREFLPTTKE